MNTPNGVLMDQAKESLKGKWKLGIKVTIILFLISLLLSIIPILGSMAKLVIGGPLMLGTYVFYLALSRQQDAKLEQVFSGFKNWTRYFIAYLWMGIYILLWSLLFIIPGVIYALAYSQTFFILAEDDVITPKEALNKSRMMMKGKKWKLFCLQLNFLGWAVLCFLTLGIGFLWLVPYMYTTSGKFYDDIKGKDTAEISAVPKTETPNLV